MLTQGQGINVQRLICIQIFFDWQILIGYNLAVLSGHISIDHLTAAPRYNRSRAWNDWGIMGIFKRGLDGVSMVGRELIKPGSLSQFKLQCWNHKSKIAKVHGWLGIIVKPTPADPICGSYYPRRDQPGMRISLSYIRVLHVPGFVLLLGITYSILRLRTSPIRGTESIN
jgi:hypothetical protein